LIFSGKVLVYALNMLEFDTVLGRFIDRQPYDIREYSPFTGVTYRHVNTDYPPLIPINEPPSPFDREPPINYHLNPPVHNPHLPGYHLNNEPYQIPETFAPKNGFEERMKRIRREEEFFEEQRRREFEAAASVGRNRKETVFQGSGHGHFSYVKGEGFHATTNVPGIGKEEGLPGGLRIKDWP